MNRHGSHLPQDFKSCVSANSTTPAGLVNIKLEAATGFEPVHKGFADPCLTTWLCRRTKKWSGRRDSNPRPPPWQGGVLPLNYSRSVNGWASRIRTCESRNQNPVPYRLAIAHRYLSGAADGNRTHECRNHNPVR